MCLSRLQDLSQRKHDARDTKVTRTNHSRPIFLSGNYLPTLALIPVPCLLQHCSQLALLTGWQCLQIWGFLKFNLDIKTGSCCTAVTNLMALLPEGKHLLPTSGAAVVWSSWCPAAPSCLQGGDPPVCPVPPAEPGCCPQLQQKKVNPNRSFWFGGRRGKVAPLLLLIGKQGRMLNFQLFGCQQSNPEGSAASPKSWPQPWITPYRL